MLKLNWKRLFELHFTLQRFKECPTTCSPWSMSEFRTWKRSNRDVCEKNSAISKRRKLECRCINLRLRAVAKATFHAALDQGASCPYFPQASVNSLAKTAERFDARPILRARRIVDDTIHHRQRGNVARDLVPDVNYIGRQDTLCGTVKSSGTIVSCPLSPQRWNCISVAATASEFFPRMCITTHRSIINMACLNFRPRFCFSQKQNPRCCEISRNVHVCFGCRVKEQGTSGNWEPPPDLKYHETFVAATIDFPNSHRESNNRNHRAKMIPPNSEGSYFLTNSLMLAHFVYFDTQIHVSTIYLDILALS